MHRSCLVMSLVICSLLLVSTVTAYSDVVQKCIDEYKPSEEGVKNIVEDRAFPGEMAAIDKCFLRCIVEKTGILHELTGEWHEPTLHEDMLDPQKVAVSACLAKIKTEDKCEEVFQLTQCYKVLDEFHMSDLKHKKVMMGTS